MGTNEKASTVNNEKLNKLLPYEKSYVSSAKDSPSSIDAPTIKDSVPYTTTGQLPSVLHMKKGAPIIITSNSKTRRYKEDGICNGACGFIYDIDTEITDDGKETVSVVWVKFIDKNVGRIMKNDLARKKMKYRNKDPLAIPIIRESTSFKYHGYRYRRSNFPIALCYAITTHKSQGQTLEKVIVDFRSEDGNPKGVFEGSFYVAITRVRNGESLILRDFQSSYVKTSESVRWEIERLMSHSQYEMLKTYLNEDIFKQSEKDEESISTDRSRNSKSKNNLELKVGHLNINSLLWRKNKSDEDPEANHIRDLNEDKNLSNLDYLLLSETWLTSKYTNEEIEDKLTNWKIVTYGGRQDHDEKQHMGQILLKQKDSDKTAKVVKAVGWPKLETSDKCWQYITIKFDSFTGTFLYINKTPSKKDLKYIVDDMPKCDFLMGDLNLNPMKPDENSNLNEFCKQLNMSVVLEENTTKMGQLDHCLVANSLTSKYFSTAYANLYSDHFAITLRIGKEKTDFKESFLKDKKHKAESGIFLQRPDDMQRSSKNQRVSSRMKTWFQPFRDSPFQNMT